MLTITSIMLVAGIAIDLALHVRVLLRTFIR